MAMPRGKKTKVVISSWQSAVRVPGRPLADLVAFVARKEGVGLSSVDIAVVDRREIARLNRRWLSRAGPTDVLSFDLSDASARGVVAQLVICGDVAAVQAAAHGQTARRELMLYVVHGLLHLMGYQDRTVRGAARMHAREDELLDAFHRRRGRGP
jgi:probable rRNA maturation factor